MKLLHIQSTSVIDADLELLHAQLVEYEARYNRLRLLVEGPSEEIGQLFNNIQVQLDAAKRGFGIVNKLKNPEYRKKHKGRVLGNMNSIRAKLNHAIKQIMASDLDLDVSNNSGYDSQPFHQDHSRQVNPVDYASWPRGKGATNV
jgi:hypothetical protein